MAYPVELILQRFEFQLSPGQFLAELVLLALFVKLGAFFQLEVNECMHE